MPITAEHIRETLAEYADAHPEEKSTLSVVLEQLDRGADLTNRKTSPVHVTAGAVVVDESGHVLFIRHNALRKYLTPGGHLEPEDTHLMGAALRELTEETGIRASIVPLLPHPVHIDVHSIPANDAKGEPAHHHADVRWLFATSGPVDVTLQAEEVSDVEWRSPDTLTDETLRERVLSVIR
ncbi:NUDIX hydrolase [Streptomyces albidoflavus]|jgi:8-oxo-dGTP pyrophosphatase MutT (NUDIX family)|uniref:NUDIX domain-containing protein n=1 Tax=Streptomyces albidoflavus TaxID=1886 RepID=A0AB37XAU0_9ACTN|nr:MULTISPECIES: NUDIX domain-containing protein [Streptomyces]MYQ73742.1 NUDIX domain-containing protein [Streptomyces sp. SID4934]MYX82629.1 NUDIX domain-containing protein [Streptomyces sp. SID4915]QLA58777.1 NUDIX domain-containing protein [Streptomyces violascens]SCE00896.1 8-oxo-dGTP pyrophosphatase MutT, NUDIX family [Streptomyces sp. IgraMP-1]AMM10762.1 NUDIX hydrolase [Streptomyces albidoflavus]